MILFKHYFGQLSFLFFFSIIFIFGSLLLVNYIETLNNDKSIFPILVYADTVEEIDKILEIIIMNEAYQTHAVVSPDSLKKFMVEKYSLDDIEEIAKDFVLPYQLYITVNPVKMDLLMLLVLEIGENFPENIIQYNDEAWREIDVNVVRLRKISFSVQLITLLIYLFIQIFIRITYILRNKIMINAIVSSGLSFRSIAWKNFVNNLIFLLLSFLLIIAVNILINYFALPHFVTPTIIEHPSFLLYININITLMLFITNMLLVVIQKPLLKRSRND